MFQIIFFYLGAVINKTYDTCSQNALMEFVPKIIIIKKMEPRNLKMFESRFNLIYLKL